MSQWIHVWPVKRHYHIQYIALDILNIQTNDNLSICGMAYVYSTSLIIVLCALWGSVLFTEKNVIVSACNYDGNQTHSYNSDIHWLVALRLIKRNSKLWW